MPKVPSWIDPILVLLSSITTCERLDSPERTLALAIQASLGLFWWLPTSAHPDGRGANSSTPAVASATDD